MDYACAPCLEVKVTLDDSRSQSAGEAMRATDCAVAYEKKKSDGIENTEQISRTNILADHGLASV
jgi:hypothetical protein